MSLSAKEKIIVALDVPDKAAATVLMDQLQGAATWVKIGLQLFVAEGPAIVELAKSRGFRVFLDLKYHDIPNTVGSAIKSACALGVDMTTIHLCGSGAMISAATKAAGDKTLVLGVSVLTSMDQASLLEVGVDATPADQVQRLVQLGVANGVRGIVCSPHEIAALRKEFGAGLAIVTPGVRPAGADIGDQKRVMTPSEAIALGASHLVIGRPITGEASPAEAFQKIVAGIA